MQEKGDVVVWQVGLSGRPRNEHIFPWKGVEEKMNTKAKGTRFENHVVRFFRESGIFAMRAPASLGIDVVVYCWGKLYGLECTTKKYVERKKVKKLIDNCRKWGIIPVLCRKDPHNRIPHLTHENELLRYVSS